MTRTPEQTARYQAKARAKTAEKAIAAGRVPGQIGTPIRISEEQRAASLAKKRKRDSKSSLRIRTAKRAEKAIQEGREPGKVGQPSILTPEQRYANFRSSIKKWKSNNKEKCTTMSRNRRARIRNAPGKHTVEDITRLWFLQKGKCTWCLQALGEEKPHVDHRVPLSKGGTNDAKNLQLLHPKCNLTKHSHNPEDFGLRHGLLAW